MTPVTVPTPVPVPVPDRGRLEPAREVCLGLLTTRARSRQELGQALTRKGYEPEVVTEVLDRLTASGLVDDAAFARAWVDQRQQRRGLSRAELERELRAKGIDPAEQAEALGTVTDEAELAAARALLARRLPAMTRLPQPVAVRRLQGLLVRRGFSPALAARLVGEALQADQADLAD